MNKKREKLRKACKKFTKKIYSMKKKRETQHLTLKNFEILKRRLKKFLKNQKKI